MGRRIPVSRAAKLIGVSRGELSRRLVAAGIETFEGEVDLDRVECIAPALKGESAAVDRVGFLRETPAKKVTGATAELARRDPEAEVRRLTAALLVESGQAERYRNLFADLAARLGELQTDPDPARRDVAFELCAWLRARSAPQ